MAKPLMKENKCPKCPHSLSNHKLGYCTASNCNCKVERNDIKSWLQTRTIKEKAIRQKAK